MSELQFNPTISDQVKVSEEALKQLIEITASEAGVSGVRIYVAGGGCGGMNYGMTLVEEPSPFDYVLEKDGMNVYVDSVAMGFLEGVEVDYKTEGVNKSFVFKNVFSNTGGGGTCGGCGSAGGGGCG